MKLIFFFAIDIRPSLRNLFHLEKLEEKGFDILILNASPLFMRQNLPPQKAIHENTVYFKSQSDVDNFSIKEQKVLFVVSDAHINIASDILLRIKRKDDILLSYSNKTFAPVRQTKNPLKKLAQLVLRDLDSIFPLFYFKHYYQLRHNQVIPDYFLGSTRYLTPTKIRLTVKRKNRIYGHSDDFNEILQLGEYSGKTTRQGVFVDQAIPFSEEVSANVFPDNYIEEYYENLNYWLTALKELYDLDKIIIALHPISMFYINEIKNYVPDFELIGGKTIQLIKQSYIVLGHFSTALGCSIYYEKPIILFQDKNILSITAWNEAIKYFNTELEIPVIDLHSRDAEKLKIDLIVSTDAYRKYKSCYIKDNSVNENSYYHAIKKIQKSEF